MNMRDRYKEEPESNDPEASAAAFGLLFSAAIILVVVIFKIVENTRVFIP